MCEHSCGSVCLLIWLRLLAKTGKRIREFHWTMPRPVRRERMSAAKTLPAWWCWTERTCFQTPNLWSAGSASWICSLETGSCWGSVSTASASKSAFGHGWRVSLDAEWCFMIQADICMFVSPCLGQAVLTFSHHAERGAGGVVSLQRWQLLLYLLAAGARDPSCESHKHSVCSAEQPC